MELHKLDLNDLDVTSFAPGEGEISFLITVGNQLNCTGCDSGCGIMGSDTYAYC